MTPSFILSNFARKTDNKPAPTTYTWEEFLSRLPSPVVRTDKDGALYAGARFEPAHRCKENVADVTVLALDYDDGAALDVTVEKWKLLGFTFAWYTTHSHQRVKNPGQKSEKPPCDRYRVVIPLDGAIPAVYYPALWRWAERQADGVVADKNTKDCSRMSYWPAKASADAVYVFGSHEGQRLNWREIPEIKYAVAAFESECAKLKSTATSDESRHDQLFKSAAALGELVAGGVLCDVHTEKALVGIGLDIGKPDDETRRTVKDGLAKGARNPRAPEQSKKKTDKPADEKQGAKDKPAEEKESAATRLVHLAGEVTLIHNADGDGFAVMMVEGHKETWLLRSKGFKRWLQRKYFERYEKAPGSQAVQDALGVIEGKALYEGPERKIFVRIGEQEGKIYLDLADDKWRAVEIDADGWRVVPIPPVEFKRSKGMLALPPPEPGGSVEDLRPSIKLKGDQWVLLLSSLVMKFRPRGPYPVDVLTGNQGSGKTTRARVIRALVDPSSADTRSAPRELRDLQIAASNEWLPIFDNLSRLPEWLSDGLCCMSTGGAMRTRELYSDADEAIFAATRPLMLTSITEVVERPDLLDRAIIYELPAIEKNQRLTEKQLWAEFNAARPRILGALLDAVSCALKNEDSVVIDDPSRMADFERWAVAAETALGFATGSFLRAYRKNQGSANDLSLESCPIADHVIDLAEQEKNWLGSAKELFNILFKGADDEEKRKRKEQGWPKTPSVLSGLLRRIAPNLKTSGVHLTFNIYQGKRKRLIRIEHEEIPEPDYAGKTASSCGGTSSDTENKEFSGDVEDALTVGADAPFSQRTHSNGNGYHSQSGETQHLDDWEDAGTPEDAVLHTQSCSCDECEERRAIQLEDVSPEDLLPQF